MQSPHVSIIMPAYNVQEFVAESVASIAAQTHPSFELIVVEDGATDATADRLRHARASWQLDPDRLIILHQPNAGAATARNRGAARARGAVLAFIDADDRWLPETLSRLVACLDAFPQSDIACPIYRRIDETGAVINYLGEPAGTQPAAPAAPRTFDAGETLLAAPAESATGVLVRREAFAAAGGFDDGLASNNDVDCWLRILWLRKSTLVQCPCAVVEYRLRAAQITSDVRRMRDGHRRFLRNHAALMRAVGLSARLRHFGLVRAYWALIAARQGKVWPALLLWLNAILLSPRLALPGTLGSSAAFAIAKAVLPEAVWKRVSALRRRMRSAR